LNSPHAPSYKGAGFTLIETIIYIALLSFIMTGSLLAAHNIIESSRKLEAKVVANTEGEFILKKIDWALNGAQTIYAPASGATGTLLSVDKPSLSASENPLVFYASSSAVEMTRGSNPANLLSTENAKIGDLIFEHIPPDAEKPRAIKVTFTLSDLAFEMTRYVRK